MVCPTLLSATVAQYSRPSSGLLCATFWASNRGFLPPFTLRTTARLSGRIARWKLTLKLLLIMNKTTRRGSYPWQNSLIITQNTPARGTRLSSSTAGSIHAFPTKRMLTPASGPKQLMSWLKNLGISQLHRERTYNMPKNYKNEPIIKELYLEITLSARKFGWTANISKPNAIRSWRQSSLGLFEFYTRWVAKPTNLSCWNNGGSMTFFMYLC